MDLPAALFLLLAALAAAGPEAAVAGASPKPGSNITVMGTVFCDICANNSFSKHSYFLRGAKVRVECSFKAAAAAREEITISVERTTDRFGVYRVDVPPVDDFQCREGREIESFCRANLVRSSSSMCNVPGLSISSEHVGVGCAEANFCVYNLNALFYRPAKRDLALCGAAPAAGTGEQLSESLDSSLFFWPPFPPFGFPWPFPHWPPFPFPFPFPTPSTSFPFPFPFPFRSPPPSFPFPFPFPSPPPPFPFPWPAPPPPSFPVPFVPPPGPPPFNFPQPPAWFPPSPPPPAFPFPFPPSLFPSPPPPPSFHFSFPPFPLTPSPPPPSPPPPAFSFPLPPFPPNPFAPAPPSPPLPSSPPPFSLTNPWSWFHFPNPTSPDEPRDHP